MRDSNLNKMGNTKILITGTAGFIGYHLAEILISEGYEVIGLDNINDYYDINLKFARLKNHGINKKSIENNKLIQSNIFPNYSFIKANLEDYDFILKFMIENKFDYVVNLAAQAGVRYSLVNPRAYTKSNIDGFLSIIEGCRYSNVKHLIYASTSSVYGLNTKMPLTESESTEHQITLYAVTKKTNELMAHSYSHLFNLPTTGLRFFTVYGPWGRPDMALFMFTKAILNNESIDVFNHGKMVRDFTYVYDIVECIKRLLAKVPTVNINWDSNNPSTSTSKAPFKIYNIGSSNPITIDKYIAALEVALKKKAIISYMDIQPGDVPFTHANVNSLINEINFTPQTNIQDGINSFVKWYTEFYLNKNLY